MNRELIEDESVSDFLDSLHTQGHLSLLEKVDQVYDWIEAGDARARPHRLDSPPLEYDFCWVIPISHANENWLLAWIPVGEKGAKVVGFGKSDLRL